MVNFNNEVTVGTPAVDVVRIIILNRWWDLQEAMEEFNKHKFFNKNYSNAIIKARALTLYYCTISMLKRKAMADKVKKMIDEDKIEDAYLEMSEVLDAVNLTKIDTRKSYDRTKIEEANKEAGY